MKLLDKYLVEWITKKKPPITTKKPPITTKKPPVSKKKRVTPNSLKKRGFFQRDYKITKDTIIPKGYEPDHRKYLKKQAIEKAKREKLIKSKQKPLATPKQIKQQNINAHNKYVAKKTKQKQDEMKYAAAQKANPANKRVAHKPYVDPKPKVKFTPKKKFGSKIANAFKWGFKKNMQARKAVMKPVDKKVASIFKRKKKD